MFDSQGRKLTEPDDLRSEVMGFYTQLLGRPADSLREVDLRVLRRGAQLSPAAAASLVLPVSTQEFDCAVKSINPPSLLCLSYY